VLPAIGGWISGDRAAYAYLPDSVLAFPQGERFTARLWTAGFVDARAESLAGGILALYRARLPR
jgi:demethylmenaquinone methyltransferase/2-methoxy-6-polyprenyl-1,4-benzoquinol methylase